MLKIKQILKTWSASDFLIVLFFFFGVVVDPTINHLSLANVCEFQVNIKIPCRSKALAFCQ